MVYRKIVVACTLMSLGMVALAPTASAVPEGAITCDETALGGGSGTSTTPGGTWAGGYTECLVVNGDCIGWETEHWSSEPSTTPPDECRGVDLE